MKKVSSESVVKDIRLEYRRNDSNNEAVMSANFYF